MIFPRQKLGNKYPVVSPKLRLWLSQPISAAWLLYLLIIYLVVKGDIASRTFMDTLLGRANN